MQLQTNSNIREGENIGFRFRSFNWLAIVASIVAGQIISTVWFVVLFGEPWAAEYGAASKQEHTKEIPGYTYGVGLLCTTILLLSISALQQALSISSAGGASGLGIFIAIGFAAATALPGQAFLKRWRAFLIPWGSQAVMILAISVILAMWKQGCPIVSNPSRGKYVN